MASFHKKSGFSLVEMLVYISILSIVSLLVIHTILSFAKSYRELGVLRVVEHSGMDSMERMTREIRAATSITAANSTLGASPGVLILVSTVGGISTTTKFYVQNGTLKVDVNGVYSEHRIWW